MDQLQVSFPDQFNNSQEQEDRDERLRILVLSVVHACQCRDPGCRLPISECCLKDFILHYMDCKVKVSGNCPICQSLPVVMFHHTKLCKYKKCDVPTYLTMKLKLKMKAFFKPNLPLSHSELNHIRLQLMKLSTGLSGTTSNVPSSSGIVPSITSLNSLPSYTAGSFDDTNRRGSLLNGNAVSVSSAVKLSNSQVHSLELRRLELQRYVYYLAHACRCRDVKCRLPTCVRTKRVIQHTKLCRLKVSGNCPVCKQLIAALYYHARRCQDKKCIVPVCPVIKQKLYRNLSQNEVLNQLCDDMASMILDTSKNTK